MTRPVWHKDYWGRVKGLVKSIEDNHNMSNQAVQEKIIKILEEENA